jgi:hypothetical protein
MFHPQKANDPARINVSVKSRTKRHQTAQQRSGNCLKRSGAVSCPQPADSGRDSIFGFAPNAKAKLVNRPA